MRLQQAVITSKLAFSHLWVLVCFVVLLFTALQFTALQQAQAGPVLDSPKKDVEAFSIRLLATFEKNVGEYKKNPGAFIHEVDHELSPVVAFDAIARGVMGRYARQAQPAQLEQFSKTFKISLLNFYGKALLKLDDTRITIEKIDDVPEKILKDYHDGKVRLVPVDMTVKTSTKTVAISYSMIHADGRWKIRNIIVDGINIGIQFRNQFAEAMDKHRKIQYVVDYWQQIMSGNTQLQSVKKS